MENNKVHHLIDAKTNRPIKFKIELTSKLCSRDHIRYLHQEVLDFIDKISDNLQMADVTTTLINEKHLISKIEEEKIHAEEIILEENNFEKYINSLPKYNKKGEIVALNYIKDYLIKNRSAKLMDIIKGCEEQGFTSKSEDPTPAFYLRLKKLVDTGQVTKKDKVYIWNYSSDN
jgi:hypothetical protein